MKHKKTKVAEERIKESKQEIKEFKKSNKNWTNITLKCIKCQEEFNITSHDTSIYTEEVKSKWTCLICDSKHWRPKWRT